MVILSTMRVADFPNPVPGSEILQCSSCGNDVWLSPSTKRLMSGKEFKALCNRCRSPISIIMEESDVVMPTPGQVKEMYDYLK